MNTQMTRAQIMTQCSLTNPMDWSTFMYNLIFKYDPLDSASTTVHGYTMVEGDLRAAGRSIIHTDNIARAVAAWQLPLVRLMVGGVDTCQGIVAGVPLIGRGLKVTPILTTLITGEKRGEWLLENISIPYNTDTYITAVETIANSGNYNFNLTPAHLGKIKLSLGDTYDYLTAKIDASLKVVANILSVNYADSTSVVWTLGATLTGAVKLDGTSLVIGAGGLSLNNPTTYIMTTGAQNIAGIKNFTTTPVCGNVPAGNTELTNKLYVDTQDALRVPIAGNMTINGIKTFSAFPLTPNAAPVANYEVANKKYVDDEILAALPQPLVYKAYITQAGGAAPTVIVVQNTIGAIVWARGAAGIYTGTLAGAFVAGKTFVTIGQDNQLNTGLYPNVEVVLTSVNVTTVCTFAGAGALDGILGIAGTAGTSITIEVWP